MFTRVYSSTVLGISAKTVSVEVDISNGLMQWNIVGLPDTAVKESKQRIASAIKNSGIVFPNRRVTINLSPADMKKEGSMFDMAITLALLECAGFITLPKYLKDEAFFVGEIQLDGSFVGKKGIFIIVADAISLGKKYVIVPYESAKEASLIRDVIIIAPKNLSELVTWIITDKIEHFKETDSPKINLNKFNIDISEVVGNKKAKRAMQIAAVGNHASLLIGSPGSGKTMLAERLKTIMPEMSLEEKIEVTKLYASTIKIKEQQLISERPFEAPHHTISSAGMIGGGSNPQIGSISLAHRGILFLDELLEYKKSCLEALRQPMESKTVTISRAIAEYTFPADFLLIAATNPCPCGYYGDKRNSCTCSINVIKNYLNKLSGPLIDRIDIHVAVYGQETLFKKNTTEMTSKDILKTVISAIDIQKKRYNSELIRNGHLNGSQTKYYCKMTTEAENAIEKAYVNLSLSMRGYFKIIKIARTIADLDNKEEIELKHISEAITYRILDKFLV